MIWWRRLLDFISPRHCVVCGRTLSPTEQPICGVCMLHLPRTTFQFTPYDNAVAQLFWGLLPVEREGLLLPIEREGVLLPIEREGALLPKLPLL